MKKNKLMIIFLIMVCAITAVGCGNNNKEENTINSQNSESEGYKPVSVTLKDSKQYKENAIKAIKYYMNRDFDESKYEYLTYGKEEGNSGDNRGARAIFKEKESKEGYYISFADGKADVSGLEVIGESKGEVKNYSKSDLQNIAVETFKKIKGFSNEEYEISNNNEGTDSRSVGFRFNAKGKEVYINIDRKTGIVNSIGSFDAVTPLI